MFFLRGESVHAIGSPPPGHHPPKYEADIGPVLIFYKGSEKGDRQKVRLHSPRDMVRGR